FGSSLQNKSAAEIKRLVEKYRNMPAANGYYILDEPINPNVFLKAYVALKEQDPSAYMHLNFLPYGAYSSVKAYISQMNDWAKLCAGAGYPLDYLMYDLYPYGLEAGSMNRTAFLTNLNTVRIAGLHNNVKTGNYIQSVEQSVAFRCPNREETLYEINMSLAFGIKQLSYFTWFTPHDRSEPFDKGIISRYGEPSDKYPVICELNNYVHTIGKTLIRCDALEVYQGKNTYDAIDLVPDDFFVQFKNKADFTLSYLRDKYDGRNYVMLVNNSFQKERSCALVFDSDIKGDISVLDGESGTLRAIAKETDGSYAFTLGAGDAVILALPEGYDYQAKKAWVPAEGENLALHAEVYCSSSVGSGGWYMNNINDGDRYGNVSPGWQSEVKKASTITLAFDRALEMNRVDVYPYANIINYGDSAAETFKLYVSDNGTDWNEISATVTPVKGAEALKKITFETVTAKYLKIECDNAKHVIKIAEIEVYNDTGKVPEPKPHDDNASKEKRGTKVVTYKKDSNVALKKNVTVSSYPASADYKSWGWWPSFLVDGTKSGWTSNVKANTSPNSTEYAIIDLGDFFEIDTVKVFPNGCWPKDFEIRVSNDLAEWTVIASETNSKSPSDCYTADAKGTVGRYVMFVGTKLTNTASDGYMLQLGEIEVYGKPHVNYEEAEMLAKRFIDLGGSADNSSYKSVMNEIANAAGSERAKGTLTQSKLDSYLKAMLEKVGTSIEEELIK
ncbi:MAG: discoidin domain-containing protein, partial [Clostridia bacterium]|nr:discoidin domain-containing protein [Clostridia bacterium]